MALLLGNTRLPRYPSRYIQLLLELVTKFTLHVGRISFVCKNKKKQSGISCRERLATWAGATRCEATREQNNFIMEKIREN